MPSLASQPFRVHVNDYKLQVARSGKAAQCGGDDLVRHGWLSAMRCGTCTKERHSITLSFFLFFISFILFSFESLSTFSILPDLLFIYARSSTHTNQVVVSDVDSVKTRL